MIKRKVRLLYLLKAPITYQVPLMQALAKESDIEFNVLYRSRSSLKPFYEPNFKKVVQWDRPLLDGYNSDFLFAWPDDGQFNFFKPFNYGVWRFLKRGGFDILWVHGYTTWVDLLAIIYAKLLGMKVFVRGESTLLLNQSQGMKRFIKPVFFKLLDRLVDQYLAIGELNKEFYINYGISPEKITLAPYTVDNNFFQQSVSVAQVNSFKEQLAISENTLILLSTSKFMVRKRIQDVLSAYQLLCEQYGKEPPLVLILVGTGEVELQLKQTVAEKSWKNVHFIGFKTQLELSALYQLADIFVLPAVNEPWGLVVNEAMNGACALLISNQVGSSADLVDEGKNGFLFNPGDINKIAEKLTWWLDHPEDCRRMGNESLLRINQWGAVQSAEGVMKAVKKVFK